MSPQPPRLAVRLLASVLRRDQGDSILGDLTEEYADRVERGAWLNTLWFWGHAVTFAIAAARQPSSSQPPSKEHFGMSRIRTGLYHALRRLSHDWRYSAAVILILAVGIGPAAAMLSVLERVLLRPLDYWQPDRLALVRLSLGQLRDHPGISPAEAIDLRTANIFEAVEVQMRLSEVTLSVQDQLVPLTMVRMTTGMLPMLGVVPHIGRAFTEADAPPPPPPPPAPGAPQAARPAPTPQRVLLDYDTWRVRFGGDPAILGRVIQLSGFPAEVIGVLPSGFRLITGRATPRPIDVYAMFQLRDFRNAWQFPTLARLKPGATFEETQAALDVVSRTLASKYPEFYVGSLRFTVTPLLADVTRATRPALRAASAAVIVLLLIAFANATALVVARLRARRLDFAIRSAIGATPRALVVEVLLESVVLTAGAALAAAIVAAAAIAGIRELIPRTVPRWEQIGVGWELLAVTAGLSLVGLFVAGLLPVSRIALGDSIDALRSGTVQGGRSESAAARLFLVGTQVALTVVLAFGCVQLVRSASRLSRVDLGFDPNVLTLRVPYDGGRFNSNRMRAELYQRIRNRVADVPGVSAVGIVTHLPLSGATMMDGYEADLSKEPSFDQPANYQAVTPGYFAAARIPILQGRDFTDQEDAGEQRVVIVDETLVRTVFPGERDVIGRMLRLGWGLDNSRIVGVVGHARTIEVARAVRPQIYVPVGNLFQQFGNVVVRASGDPRQLAPAVERAIQEIGPGRAISNVVMLNENVTAATSTVVAVTWLVTFLAASGALLSAVGLYLLVAFIVHQRRRAAAIQTALGASRRQVMWSNLRSSGIVMSIALPVGIVLSLIAGPFLADLLYEVTRHDPVSMAVALVVAVTAGVLGTYIPVRRAADANVVQILRES
jgi:predicted permease